MGIPKKIWPPTVMEEKTRYSGLWLPRPLHASKIQTIEQDQIYSVSHTSFTLHSAFEYPAFLRSSSSMFGSLENDDEPVEGFVASTGLIAPFSKTLHTLTIWQRHEDEVAWLSANGVHRKAVSEFYAERQFSASPRHYIEILKIKGSELPPSTNMNEFWENLLAHKFSDSAKS